MYFRRELKSYLFASISQLQRSGKKDAVSVLQGAEPSLTENTEVDNWDGGTYYHTLTLLVPICLYEQISSHINEVEGQIRDTVNAVSRNMGNESLELVRILPKNIIENERLLPCHELPTSSENDDMQIWDGREHRVFFSHLTDYKQEASDLKHKFGLMGISCFVAHEDIEPTKEWQIVIEKALKSCTCVVALMHERFHESNWTDQEIGIAYGLGKPIITVLQGTDPYGFIGKSQGIRDSSSKLLWWEVLKCLPFIRSKGDALILALSSSERITEVREIANHLPEIEVLDNEQTKRLFEVAQKNPSVKHCWVLWKGTSSLQGLCRLLKQWVAIDVVYNDDTNSVVIPNQFTIN